MKNIKKVVFLISLLTLASCANLSWNDLSEQQKREWMWVVFPFALTYEVVKLPITIVHCINPPEEEKLPWHKEVKWVPSPTSVEVDVPTGTSVGTVAFRLAIPEGMKAYVINHRMEPGSEKPLMVITMYAYMPYDCELTPTTPVVEAVLEFKKMPSDWQQKIWIVIFDPAVREKVVTHSPQVKVVGDVSEIPTE